MECNPFHNGHEHIITAAKEQFGADHVIVVLSGDHVQRGEPAIMDKYARTDCVLHAGADLVLELPVALATGSAQYFARGGVSALLHTGVVDALLFGSECGDISALQAQTDSLTDTASDHSGRHIAMEDRLSPNDLLAAEYVKALDFFTSRVCVHTIARQGASYHDTDLTQEYASASGLRRLLHDNEDSPESAQSYMPSYANDALTNYCYDHRLMFPEYYSDLLFYALLREQANGYTAYFDVFDALSQKIRAKLGDYSDLLSFLQLLKSKDIAYSHLSRALLHILLGITKEQVSQLTDLYEYCPYLRILGLRKDASDLLHAVKENADRPLLSKPADARTILSPVACSLLEQDIFASTLYAKIASKNGGIVSEYRRSPIIL